MRILVVEDEIDLANAVVRGLRREGFAVDLAADGSSAIDKATVNDYDVILLDRDLPRVHGDDVCAELRASGEQARILMLTAAASIPDRVAGLDLGADDYLGKPFDFEELKARVRASDHAGDPRRSAAAAHAQGVRGAARAARGRRRGCQPGAAARACVGRTGEPVHELGADG